MEIKCFFDHDKEGHITSVNKPGERITGYAYDNNYNLTGITDPSGRTEKLTYDAGSRRTSYTMNGGNSIPYDYDALNDLVERTYRDENGDVQKSIGNTVSEENPSGVLYGCDDNGYIAAEKAVEKSLRLRPGTTSTTGAMRTAGTTTGCPTARSTTGSTIRTANTTSSSWRWTGNLPTFLIQ